MRSFSNLFSGNLFGILKILYIHDDNVNVKQVMVKIHILSFMRYLAKDHDVLKKCHNSDKFVIDKKKNIRKINCFFSSL